MAEERIDEIIGREAFEQVRQLSEELKGLNEEMVSLIQTASQLKQGISQATSYKELNTSVAQANNVTQQYVETAQKAVDTQAKIADASKRAKISWEEYDRAVDGGREAMKSVRSGTDELIGRMLEEQKIIKENAAARKELEKALNANRDTMKENRDIIAMLGKEEKQLRDKIEATKDAMRKSGSGEEYDRMVGQLQKAEGQLKKNIEEQNRHRDTIQKTQEVMDANSDRINKLTQSEIEHKAALSEVSVAAKQNLELEESYAGSLKEMQSLLKSYTTEYAKLTQEERENSDIGGAMRDAIQALQTKMKELKVEEFGARTVTLRTQLRMLRESFIAQTDAANGAKEAMEAQAQTVAMIAQEKGKESQEYKDAKERLDALNTAYAENQTQMMTTRDALVELTKKQRIANAEVQVLSDPNGGLKAMTQGLQTVAAGYNVAIGLTNMFGGDTEKLKNALAKVLLVQQTMNAVTQVANNLKKTSALVIKTENLYNQIRLKLMKKNTEATIAQTAAQKTETVATVEGTAATGALAAGETVATATSFTLAGALKAVGAAIKSIPIIGWLLAGAAALAGIIKLVYNVATAEEKLTFEQQRRKEMIEGIGEARKEALSDTRKEAIELDRSVAKIKEAKEGTQEQRDAISEVADKLGVSSEWLTKNIDKVDSLTDAWKRMRYAQALTDALITKAADTQVKAEEKILEMREKSQKERKKMLREQGYSRREARGMSKDGSLAATENAIRESARRTAEGYIKEADRVESEVKDDIADVVEAQKQGANTSTKTVRNALTEQQKEAEKAKEYYKGILKRMSDDENRQYSKNTRHRLEALEKQQAEEAAKYRINTTLTEEERTQIAEYYSRKRREIMEDEMRDVAAAYAVVTEQTMAMLERQVEKSGAVGEALSEQMTAIENARAQELRKSRDREFEETTKGLDESSSLYVALKAKYDKQIERDEQDHQDKLEEIRKKASDKSLKQIKDFYESWKKAAYGDVDYSDDDVLGGFRQMNDRLKQLGVETEMISKQQREMQRRSYESYIDNSKDGFKDLESFSREYSYLAKTDADAARTLYGSLSESQREMVDTFIELKNKQKENENETEEINRSMAKSYIELGSSVASSMLDIGEALQDLFGKSVGLTVGMQAIAMAQVLANQAVAISDVVTAAMNEVRDKGLSLTTLVKLIATIGAGVAAVMSQMATAKKAIQESKQALQGTREVETYAEGTDYHTGGDAVVGEGGRPELVLSRGRSYVIDKPTYIKDMPVGSKVIPLDAGADGNGVDLTEVLASMDDLKRKERVQINVGKNVYSYIVGGANRARILNRQFSH